MAAVQVQLVQAEQKLRRMFRLKTSELAEQARTELETGGWNCPRCEAENLLFRAVCYWCNLPIPVSMKSAQEAALEIAKKTPGSVYNERRVRRKRGGRKRNKRKYDSEESEQNHPFAHGFEWGLALAGSVAVVFWRQLEKAAETILETATTSVVAVLSTPTRAAVVLHRFFERSEDSSKRPAFGERSE